ncbi:MAG: hypothetical protein JWR35_224 [Marmoricola sp.]|jgi:hypothetical protein|nr:hypothetical protein [Marmoricola sp.]
MDTFRFWDTIEQARATTDGSIDAQVDAIEQALTELHLDDVIAFRTELVQASQRLYTWENWGAATVILGYCSDDAFQDFRSWVIAQGRRTFESFVNDPDSIVDVGLADDDEIGAAEMLSYVADNVYEKRAGRTIWVDLPDSPALDPDSEPTGHKFEETDEVLKLKYPRLAQAYMPEETASLQGGKRRLWPVKRRRNG